MLFVLPLITGMLPVLQAPESTETYPEGLQGERRGHCSTEKYQWPLTTEAFI